MCESTFYQPLEDGCFRVLHLQGAGFDATISCTLKHVSFQQLDSITYNTVSYSWGTDIGTTKIWVNGKKANVPQNAAEALRWLRPQDSSTRVLWIDSVCIDQYNLEERGVQVAMMADIYSNADTNLIWLGEDDGTIESALANINILTLDLVAQTDNLATFPLGPGPNHHLHQSSGIDVKFDAQPIIRLLERPWFSRLWVVQEATLAKVNICHCGPYIFDLVPLLRVAEWLWTKHSHIGLHDDDNFRQIRRIFTTAISLHDVVDQHLGWLHHALKQGWFNDKHVTSPLFSILDTTTQFNAALPVDHVFVILGLWLRFSPPGTTLPALLQPNYTKSISDVFCDATRQAMVESHSLALWQNHYHRPAEDYEDLPFPTWVRRWNRAFDPHCDPTSFHRGVFAHANWRNDTFDPAPSLPSSIVLSGIFIDDSAERSTIDVTSSISSTPSLDPSFITEIERLIADHPHVQGLHYNDIDTALATVLVAAESAERDVATPDDLLGLSDLKHFWSGDNFTPLPTLLQLSSSPKHITIPPTIRRAVRYAEAAWRMCHFRRFLITGSGRIGLGPQTMRSGDIAVVTYGCEWPVVLRRDTEMDRVYVDVWKVVGMAWVYGVMKGEAVERHVDIHGEEGGDVGFVII